MRHICLRLLSVLLLLSAFKATSAQKIGASKIDSLVHKLQIIKPDSNKVILLNTIFKAYNTENPGKALPYAKQQLVLALKINYINGEINAYKNLGKLYSRFGDYPAAIKFYEKAYDILRSKKLVAQQYRLLLTIGVYYRFNKQYEEALKRFYTLYNYYKNKPGVIKSHNIYVDESWQAVAWQISIAYNAQGNNKAVENFLSGILNDYQQKKDADGVLSAQFLLRVITVI